MTKNSYIDNDKFLEELIEYKARCKEAEEKGETPPALSNYIGQCFLKIAERFSNHHYFIGYSYKDEMISDAVENCVMVVRNFDPEISKNPFAYFTQITYFAFRRRIIRERKQQEIKYKIIEDIDIAAVVDSDDEEMMRYLAENVRKQVDNDEKVSYTINSRKKPRKAKPSLFD